MAHRQAKRIAVRRGYVQQRLPLSEAARQAGVAAGTARTWKRKARLEGDDWDRARAAARMAEGGLGTITERVLNDFSILFTSTMASLRDHDGDPIETARALATLSDAYAKTVKAAGGVDPRLARLSIALETLERLGGYVREHRPDLALSLIEVLEPFGSELSAQWS